MEILKFTLSGDTAFFKKPDVNSYYYFTYGNIHKIALMGIMGAILGFGGYNQQKIKNDIKKSSKSKELAVYPEFYERLKDIELSIVPLQDKGYTNKKVQVFNNSVGYASKEEGGNLIVKEQWLEKPIWDIYISLNDEKYTEELRDILKEFKERMINRNFVYIPYLGKNDHYANITDVKIYEGANKTYLKQGEVTDIYSLTLDSMFSLENDSMEEDDLFETEVKWKYQERLPMELENSWNQYITSSCINTNFKLRAKSETYIFEIDGKRLFFL